MNKTMEKYGETKEAKTNPLAYFIVGAGLELALLLVAFSFKGLLSIKFVVTYISVLPIFILGVWAPGIHSAISEFGYTTLGKIIHTPFGMWFIVMFMILIAPNSSLAPFILYFGIGIMGHFLSHPIERKMVAYNICLTTLMPVVAVARGVPILAII